MAFQLGVTTPAGIEIRHDPCRLAAGETRSVEISVPACRPVRVRVRNRNTGGPVEGATVKLWIRSTGSFARSTSFEAVTPPDGALRFPSVPPGDLDADVTCPGFRATGAEFGLDGKGDEVEVALIPIHGYDPAGATTSGSGSTSEDWRALAEERERKERGDLAIAGRLLGPDGEPVRGAVVRAYRTEGDLRDGYYGRLAVTSPDGGFRYEQLADGEWFLDVSPVPDLAPLEPVTVKAGATDVELRLSPGRSVTLTVLGRDDEPLAGALVSIHPPGSEFMGDLEQALAFTTTGPDGRARLSGLPTEGEVGLSIEPPGRGQWEPRDIRIEEWTPRDETFRFEPTLSVGGRIVNRRGEPLSEAVLSAWQDGERRFWFDGPADDGTFCISGLAPGPVEIAAGPNGRVLEPGDASRTVPAGASDVLITVDEGCAVAVSFANARPSGRLAIQVGAGDRWLAIGGFAEAGETLTFAGLPPGPVAVLVEEEAGDGPPRVGLLTGVSPGLTPVPVEVVLAQGHRIRGRVVLPEAAENLRVSVRPPRCPPIHVFSRDSSFGEGNLPPGPYRATFRFEVGGEAREVERALPTDFDGELHLR
jgi:protocatechuate 3,4-dioxygenase beta subunit